MAEKSDEMMVADVEGVHAAPAREVDAPPFVGGLLGALGADPSAWDEVRAKLEAQ